MLRASGSAGLSRCMGYLAIPQEVDSGAVSATTVADNAHRAAGGDTRSAPDE